MASSSEKTPLIPSGIYVNLDFSFRIDLVVVSSSNIEKLFSTDEKNDTKEESKSTTKPESGSGAPPSPSPTDPGLDFNAFDFSGMAGILNVSSLLWVYDH